MMQVDAEIGRRSQYKHYRVFHTWSKTPLCILWDHNGKERLETKCKAVATLGDVMELDKVMYIPEYDVYIDRDTRMYNKLMRYRCVVTMGSTALPMTVYLRYYTRAGTDAREDMDPLVWCKLYSSKDVLAYVLRWCSLRTLCRLGICSKHLHMLVHREMARDSRSGVSRLHWDTWV